MIRDFTLRSSLGQSGGTFSGEHSARSLEQLSALPRLKEKMKRAEAFSWNAGTLRTDVLRVIVEHLRAENEPLGHQKVSKQRT